MNYVNVDTFCEIYSKMIRKDYVIMWMLILFVKYTAKWLENIMSIQHMYAIFINFIILSKNTLRLFY